MMKKVKTIKRFQTFSAGGHFTKKEDEKLLPTDIKPEEDPQTNENKELLLPTGIKPTQ